MKLLWSLLADRNTVPAYGLALLCLALAPVHAHAATYGGAINSPSPSPAFAFPQNAAYPYGIKPNHKTAAQFQADVVAMYNTWLLGATTDSGAGGTAANGVKRWRVVRHTDGDDTVSEGIGYGMLIAAVMADMPLFDGIWMYANQYMPDTSGNYLMNWKVDSSGNVTGDGHNGATDADVDMCQGLLLAHKQWGSAGTINYLNEFRSMASAIWSKEIANAGDFHVKPGDAWDGTYFSSYMSPAWFRCWAGFESTPHAWTSPINWIYNSFFGTVLAAYPKGFKPENTSSSFSPNTMSHGYDASRYGWRIGQDYLWNGDAKAYANVNAMANSIGGTLNNVKEFWDIGSGVASGSSNSLQIGPAIIACQANAANQGFVNSLYDEMKNNRYAKPSFTYFQDTLCMVSVLVATGNFPNMACGAPAGTNTVSPTISPTFTVSPTQTPTQTPTPAFGLAKSASVATAAVGSTFYYYIDYANLSTGPDSTGVTPGVSLNFNNAGSSGTGTRFGANFQIVNASGAAINLQNYRVRYFLYDATHVATTDYATYKNYDSTNVGTAAMAVYSPAYTLGPRNANMEEDLTYGSYTLNNGSSSDLQGQVGSTGDSWTQTFGDDWSYPGASSSYAAATYAVLEQNVAGSWKLVSGQFPGGSVAVANVTLSDTLDSRLTLVGLSSGSFAAGVWSVTLASLAPSAAGRITLTVQVNGTASAGQTIPNSASMAASGFPTANAPVCNVSVSGGSTPTFTPTVTLTATRTATPSASPTATPSRTASPSATASATRTASPSATQSNTPGPSATATPTATPSTTPTPALTSTFTATTTATRSVTPSLTASASATPQNSFTATPTDTPPSPGSTLTDSPTQSPSFSASPTASWTATPSATPSATASASPTATLTASPAATATQTPLPDTATATPTNSPGPSSTFSLTATSTGSATPTYTATQSNTPGPSGTPTFTATLSRTPPPTQTAVPTATAQPGGPTATILEHHAWPNPSTGLGPLWIGVKLDAPCAKLKLKIYTRGMVCTGAYDLGGAGKGWNQLLLDAGALNSLPTGQYYYEITAGSSKAGIGRITLLR